MPHITLETTADLFENAHIPDILEALVEALSKFETVDAKAIKAYHTLRSNWHMGAGAPPGFAHCTVGMIEGRPIELRKRISDALFGVMMDEFKFSIENEEVSLTLELREFNGETYRKR